MVADEEAWICIRIAKRGSQQYPLKASRRLPAGSVRLALCMLQLLWRRCQVRHVRLHAGLARLHALALGAAVAAAEATGPAACDLMVVSNGAAS